MAWLEHGVIWLPNNRFGMNSGGSSMTMGGATHKAAGVWHGGIASGTYDQIKVCTATVTTGCTLEARVETVDANGDPSGTLYSAGASGTLVVANTDDNVFLTFTLGTAVTIDEDDDIAIVLVVSAGTPSNLQIRTCGTHRPSTPYQDFYNGATWTKAGSPMQCALRSTADSQFYVMDEAGGGVLANTTINSTTTPDEIGMKITVPYDCRLRGAALQLNNGSGPNDFDCVVYDNANNVVSTATVYGACRASAGGRFFWALPQASLTRGGIYRIVYKGIASLSNQVIDTTYVWSADDPFTAAQACKTSRTDAGAWTDDTTRRVSIFMLVDRIVVPTLHKAGA